MCGAEAHIDSIIRRLLRELSERQKVVNLDSDFLWHFGFLLL
jgi:hypothetical protein